MAFSEKAKRYLVEVFWIGEETCKKVNASDVASRMKSLREEISQKLSVRIERLTGQDTLETLANCLP